MTTRRPKEDLARCRDLGWLIWTGISQGGVPHAHARIPRSPAAQGAGAPIAVPSNPAAAGCLPWRLATGVDGNGGAGMAGPYVRLALGLPWHLP